MSSPIQDFDHRHSQYERPTMRWVCGWQAQGQPCHVGPDSRGRCQAHRECVPHFDGEEFICARPPVWGGKCKEGPLPDGSCCQLRVRCQPRWSLFAKRRMAAILTSTLAFGVLLIMFGDTEVKPDRPISKRNLTSISPGDLTTAHNRGTGRGCAECHQAADGSIDGFLRLAFHPRDIPRNDSLRCVECHEDSLGAHPLYAHSMDPERLQKLKSPASKMKDPFVFTVAELGPRMPNNIGDELFCSMCHHEHRGRFFDMKQMTNQQCQNCHVNKFHSLRDGHPQFVNHPYTRRARIHFDHSTHYGSHFANFKRVMPEGESPGGTNALKSEADGKSLESSPTRSNEQSPNTLEHSCRSCHDTDDSKRHMRIGSFEVMCGKCHGPQIRDTHFPGIQFVAIPQLDVDKLNKLGIAIGEWPSKTTNLKFDELPPFMQLLLAGDPKFIEAQKTFTNIDWTKLDDTTENQRQAIQTVVWSIKRLIRDLSLDPDNVRIRDSLKSLADSPPRIGQLPLLAGKTAPDVSLAKTVQQWRSIWFPNLASDIEAHEAGEPVELKKTDVGIKENPDTVASTGWYIDIERTSIRYRSTGHADPFLKEWIDVTSRDPGVARDFGRQDARPKGFKSTAAGRLLDILADPKASFRCIDCHTIDQMNDNSIVVNWTGLKSSLDTSPFNKFSHKPHIMLMHSSTDSDISERACVTCHELKMENYTFLNPDFVIARPDWHVNTNPNTPCSSGFSSMRTSTCAKCHTPQRVGDSCLTCHKYHVGSANLSN